MDLLYSYKMSHDDGFAPNPYFGVLTLATCMGTMRQNTKVGNWIAGWTSRKTATSTPPGEERLIYLAKVTDKISIAEYWDRFPMKRPSNQMKNRLTETTSIVPTVRPLTNCVSWKASTANRQTR